MEAPLDAAAFLSELTPLRDYRGCSESLARLMAVFRTLVGKIVVDRDKQTKVTTVSLLGPISHVSGENTFAFVHETRVPRHIDEANKRFRENAFLLSDNDWRKIASHLPLDSIWIEEFDEPVALRTVLNAIIFRKWTRIGIGNSAGRFGPKGLVWTAARMLNYAGALSKTS